MVKRVRFKSGAVVVFWLSAALAGESDLSRFQRPFTAEEKNHWAFQPAVKPSVPAIQDPARAANPIDAFILARLEKAGLRQAPPASRVTWLRRVTFDLIGLPPTPQEQENFLADLSPQAHEKVVDDLLSRPQYGERWARHWLDVARYAESNGYERDGTKPSAWRYRDYVIEALNRDRPFDRFILEQLAGDEIEGSNAETQIATTFLRLGTWDDEPADPKVDRYEQLDDVIAATATAFLGLTLRCARCHNHKYEPLAQMDYYRFQAVFEPLRRPQDNRADQDRLVGTEEELKKYREAAALADRQITEVHQKIGDLKGPVRDRLFEERKTSLPQAAVAAFQTEPGKRTEDQKKLVQAHQKKLDDEIEAASTEAEKARLVQWQGEAKKIDAARPPEPPRGYIWEEEKASIPPTAIFTRGDPYQPVGSVAPGLPAIFSDPPEDPPKAAARTSGRRLWLGRWIASPKNPLTARVIVNRLWQRHFGQGLVATENDFGLMGERPSHPELLDWLAAAFLENGWSLKAMHRLMVLSNTYRLSAGTEEESLRKDPANRLLWRWKPRRLEAEAVRDAVLAASGRLNLAMGGPSIFPAIPRAVIEGQSVPGQGWGKSDPLEAARRSVYIFIKRSVIVPELELLDFPDTTSCCEERLVSTVAPQALTFLNGDFANEQAAAMAERLEREAGPDRRARIQRAFQIAMARPAAEREIALAEEFLRHDEEQAGRNAPAAAQAGQTVDPDKSSRQALSSFCLALLNSNEFFYLE